MVISSPTVFFFNIFRQEQYSHRYEAKNSLPCMTVVLYQFTIRRKVFRGTLYNGKTLVQIKARQHTLPHAMVWINYGLVYSRTYMRHSVSMNLAGEWDKCWKFVGNGWLRSFEGWIYWTNYANGLHPNVWSPFNKVLILTVSKICWMNCMSYIGCRLEVDYLHRDTWAWWPV